MRRKRLVKNTGASLALQLTTIVCGFIVPRLILQSYGSEVNGLVNSITQFLAVISFLELGMGAVVQSALYKPLAEQDSAQISRIIASAQKFFKTIAVILLIYIFILIIAYSHIANQEFGFMYNAVLILAMGVSSFAQYYFGVVDRLLLTADQKGYIQYIVQIITLVINTYACAVLINMGASIHIVKLVTSLIYLIRPLVLRLYVNRNYSIDRKIEYVGEPIKQKWNGVAQHVAAIVLDGTDSIVLTVLASLSDVSVYSVYHLVVYGIKNLFLSLMAGVKSLLGELWAKKDYKRLNVFFELLEWIIHVGVTYVWGCTLILIVPFVQVYTKGINDTNYNVPLFAFLITVANALHCLRLPYNNMILAAGHYKQTQNNYIVAAILNVSISIITVKAWGLVGVALGTLLAMLYQTVWLAVYSAKNLVKRPIIHFVKYLCVDCVTIGLILCFNIFVKLESLEYISWVFMAIKVMSINLMVILLVNIVFYYKMVVRVINQVIRRLK